MEDEVVTFKLRGRRVKASDVKLALSGGKVCIPMHDIDEPRSIGRTTTPASTASTPSATPVVAPTPRTALCDLTNRGREAFSTKKALVFVDSRDGASTYQTRRVV